jgi:hypothetical protein
MPSPPPSVADWANFFAAEVGATASLTGLVIVAISINLARIIAFPHLPGRAIETLTMLVGVLIVATMGLVPGQPTSLLGWEIMVVGLTMWLASVLIQLRARGAPIPGTRWAPVLRMVVGQATSLPFVVAGGVIHFRGPIGLYWLLPGVIVCLVAAVMNAWVLLVEIIR